MQLTAVACLCPYNFATEKLILPKHKKLKNPHRVSSEPQHLSAAAKKYMLQNYDINKCGIVVMFRELMCAVHCAVCV